MMGSLYQMHGSGIVAAAPEFCLITIRIRGFAEAANRGEPGNDCLTDPPFVSEAPPFSKSVGHIRLRTFSCATRALTLHALKLAPIESRRMVLATS